MGPVGASGISITGDVSAGQFHVPRAQALLRNLVERLALAGLPSGRDHAVLSDHAYCYAIVSYGVQRAVIVVDTPPDALFEPSESFIPITPDFYSGAALGGVLTRPVDDEPQLMQRFWPTTECAELFGIPEGLQDTRKLAVKPWGPYNEPTLLGAPQGARNEYSQYVKLRPTMYSGAMRKVVQLLMGFGRQTAEKSIYDEAEPDLRGEEAAAPTKYEQDVAKDGLQIRYDWRWFRTHGITRASDGRLWLVEVGSTRGIIAMPLPMHPLTQTPEFVDKLEGMGDDAGLYAIERLGGFPTGEAFPTGDIEPWIRAGVVVRLAASSELAEFYGKSAYSSAMGWAFNERGSEAHNTCYSFAENNYQIGWHYAVRLSVGATVEIEEAPNAAALRARITRLSEPDAQAKAPLLAKTYRMDEAQVRSVMQNPSDETMIDELDALQVTPIAPASGGCSVMNSGPLYDPSKYQRAIKFPEPDLGYLLSHDMRPSFPALGSDAPKRCDTVMHVFFARDRLCYAKYFRNDKPIPAPEIESDFEDCMYVGSWTQIERTGMLSIPPMMYTEAFDDREERAGTERTTKVNSVDLGYTSIVFGDIPERPYLGFTIRRKTFRRKTNVHIVNGAILGSTITVPFHDRCAYYYVVAKGSQGQVKFEINNYNTLTDPWTCNTWRNFPGWTGFLPMGCLNLGNTPSPNFPACWKLEEHPDGCGPVTYRAVRAPGPIYNGGDCSDFADSGPWCFLCENVEDKAFSVPLPPLTNPPNQNIAGVVDRAVYLVNDTDFSPFLVDHQPARTPLNYETMWFIPSPDPDTNSTQYLDETHNAFGEAQIMRAWREPNGGDIILRGGPQHPEMLETGTTWVGVV